MYRLYYHNINGWYVIAYIHARLIIIYNDNTPLRVQALAMHKTGGICHVYCIFKPGYTCQTTIIFRIMKDVSLLIHSLASINCFT